MGIISNQLVMNTLNSFNTITTTLRRMVAVVLRKASEKNKSSQQHVGFGTILSQLDLERLQPFLTPEAAADATAATFGVPKSWLRVSSFEAPLTLPVDSTNPKTNTEKATERAKHKPPPGSDRALTTTA